MPKDKEDLNIYDVSVYNGHHLIEVIRVKANDHAEASSKALNEFFEDINVKIKRAW